MHTTQRMMLGILVIQITIMIVHAEVESTLSDAYVNTESMHEILIFKQSSITH